MKRILFLISFTVLNTQTASNSENNNNHTYLFGFKINPFINNKNIKDKNFSIYTNYQDEKIILNNSVQQDWSKINICAVLVRKDEITESQNKQTGHIERKYRYIPNEGEPGIEFLYHLNSEHPDVYTNSNQDTAIVLNYNYKHTNSNKTPYQETSCSIL